MAEHWAAVATAINQRLGDLGLRQRELARRSTVSLAIVREIQHHVVERRRSPRTFESLSVAPGGRACGPRTRSRAAAGRSGCVQSRRMLVTTSPYPVLPRWESRITTAVRVAIVACECAAVR